MSRAVLVALPVPALDALSYEVPVNLSYPEIGTRVLVPLGKRVLTGCVVGRPDDSRTSAGVSLRQLLEVLDFEPQIHDLIDRGGIVAIEWADRLATPYDGAIQVNIEDQGDDDRLLTVERVTTAATSRA